jgi:hypothetical protein
VNIKATKIRLLMEDENLDWLNYNNIGISSFINKIINYIKEEPNEDLSEKLQNIINQYQKK